MLIYKKIQNAKFSFSARKCIFFSSLMLLFFRYTLGQEASSSEIRVIARVINDSIVLRWVPTNFDTWNWCNKNGYTIERVTILKDGKVLKTPESKILTQTLLRPWTLSKMELPADKDKYIAIMAQAIYGSSFDVTAGNTNKGIFDIVNQSLEQDNRFSFAMYAADMSPNAARAGALLFSDNTVMNNENYLYKVYPAVSPIFKVDTGYFYIGIDEAKPLPKPSHLKAESMEKTVYLSWEKQVVGNFYTSYWIERSDDGGRNYHKITKEPFVYAHQEKQYDTPYYLFVDSVVPDKTYHYRICGINAFGEIGPFSDSVSVKASNKDQYLIYITEKYATSEEVFLKWKPVNVKEDDIAGYKVLRSELDDKGYKILTDSMLSPAQYEYHDKDPMLSNYYKIMAIGKSGNQSFSYPVLVQLIDTIPPSSPTKLSANVDTTGKLILTWNANHEADIYGYRIYRANASDEEYSQITVSPVTDTVFVDHINLKTLTKKIYYQIMAIDKRQNHSGFSEPLEVERPDIVPPAPPAIVYIKSTPEGVALKWEKSSSADVVKHLIYRRDKGLKEGKIIKEVLISDTMHVFMDTSVLVNATYYYSIVAEDNMGLKSISSGEFAGQKIVSKLNYTVDGLKLKPDRKSFTITLSWDKPKLKVNGYIIYRKIEDDGILSVYKSISGEKNEFTDSQVKMDRKYIYSVKPVFENGETGIVSNEVSINF